MDATQVTARTPHYVYTALLLELENPQAIVFAYGNEKFTVAQMLDELKNGTEVGFEQ